MENIIFTHLKYLRKKKHIGKRVKYSKQNIFRPCSLFSNENVVWSKSGFENLNIFTLSITVQGMRSRQTVSSVFFVEIVECLRKKLDEQKRVSDLHHNEKLTKKIVND